MATDRRRVILRGLRKRLIEVLLMHEAELSEFLWGFVALVLGLVMALWGSPVGEPEAAFWGGLALSLFGLPQMVSAIWGSLRARHVSNIIGAFAGIVNTVRAAEAGVVLAVAFYLMITLGCVFFWWRTEVARAVEQFTDEEREAA